VIEDQPHYAQEYVDFLLKAVPGLNLGSTKSS